jgi:hypothetical protein
VEGALEVGAQLKRLGRERGHGGEQMLDVLLREEHDKESHLRAAWRVSARQAGGQLTAASSGARAYLHVDLDDGLAEERCAEEGPERHEEVAAADAAQIERRVGPRSHEEHTHKAVVLQEANHPHLRGAHMSTAGAGGRTLSHSAAHGTFMRPMMSKREGA